MSPDWEMFDNIQFGGATMGLTFYTDLADFASLKTEDFSEITLGQFATASCDEPFDSTTDNACFAPGDIASRISFRTLESTNCPTCMTSYGPDYPQCAPGIMQKQISTPGDNIQIDFTGNVKKVGTHFYNGAFMAYVYDSNGNLLGAKYVPAYTCTGGYWGVKSQKEIGRVVLGMANETIFLDYVLFGSKFPWAMFIPKKQLPNPQ